MTSDNPKMIRVLDALSAAEDEEGHPEIGELVAYQERKLSDERRDEVRRHLASCAPCSETVLDLAAFPAVTERGQSASWTADDGEAIWRSLEGRLRGPEVTDRPPKVQPAPVGAGATTVWRAIAAILALVCAGLAAMAWSLYDSPDGDVERAAPFDSLSIQALTPVDGDIRSSTRSPTRIEAPGLVALYLAVPRLEPFDDYRAVLVHGESGERWQARSLERDAQGGFSVRIDSATLPPGTYRLQLLGRRADESSTLGTYTFELRPHENRGDVRGSR